MNTKTTIALALAGLVLAAGRSSALDRPWIGDVFFYWYTWDYDRQLGSWMGGVHNTPLGGYYDSRTLRDNRRSLWVASEWGMTHHFMDYWAPDWKGEGGRMREAIVLEAAESLRQEGYDIWMAYYQDGQNFEMREFSRNVAEKRDVHQWLCDFSRSPVWPKIDGQPLQLVYSRNGSPQTTLDHAGFRRFLQERYAQIETLNKAWGSGFGGFDQIEMTFGSRGHQRALSIAYQYSVWEREWQKLNGLVQKQFGLPGMRASFDVGYGPYMGFGFADFVRVFGGPHSYAGIFGQPHEEDAQRYIQASLARKYNTVFFDHLKNHYFDWDIRVPGMAFHPEPFHFDRFWVGALARRSEALLHLSWNEWWEGSNLEPCQEFGKTYCEKNLFYATLMKLAFDSIRDAERAAPVGLVLNDWRFASGAQFHEELYQTIQTLRRLCVPFDLVPDGLVTPEELSRFTLLIVPAYGCGLGYNARGEPIADVLRKWLQTSKRRLVISDHPSLRETFGLREGTPPAAAKVAPGPDMNLLIDVGAEGDDKFLRSGYSGRESWGGVPRPGDPRSTFRWTPAVGDSTSFLLPASPGRDHVLRVIGRTMWPNRLTVLINGREAAKADLPAGEVRLEIPVPAAALGPGTAVSLDLRYAQSQVPSKVAPAQYPGEARVCNLALESLQWSTANIPAGTKQQRYTELQHLLRLTGELFGEGRGTTIAVPGQPRAWLEAPGAKAVSRIEPDGFARDLLLAVGPSEVLYLNGPLSEVQAEQYWVALVGRWAQVEFHRFVAAPHTMANLLRAGDTQFVVVFNEDIGQRRLLALVPAASVLPLAEATVLARDADQCRPLAVQSLDPKRFHDTMGYYGVYQFAFSPVRVEQSGPPALAPGESAAIPVKVTNLTGRPVRATLEAASVIPTVRGKPVQVEVPVGQPVQAKVPISVAPTADWGRKTIYFRVECEGRQAVFLRELVVLRLAEPEILTATLNPHEPVLEVRGPSSPHGRTAPIRGASVSVAGRTIALGDLQEGQTYRVPLPPYAAGGASLPPNRIEKIRLQWREPRGQRSLEKELMVLAPDEKAEAAAPQGSLAAISVFNPQPRPIAGLPVAATIAATAGPVHVRDGAGREVLSQLVGTRTLWLAPQLPARSWRTCYLLPGPSAAKSDLEVTPKDLGSGNGTLSLSNAHLRLVLSEAAGGTLTSLVSRKTGRDYGRRSLGIAYGTFSRYDPKKPTTTTIDYIDEKKVRQEDSPGRIELLASGPVVAIARVRWADQRVEAEQVYEFPAGQPYFVLRQKVRPRSLAGQQELVAINAQFRPNRLTKSFPNFVGIPDRSPRAHFGWRMGDWVPEYATLMAPDHFDESLSLVLTQKSGLKSIRQGFWPEKRPQAGPCAVAQIELLGDLTAGCDAELYVLLHKGHQIVARRFREDLALAPKAKITELVR